MVDAAIDRLADEHLERERVARGEERDSSEELDLALYETSAPSTRASRPSRLRWKGLDVSDEFRSYAERIARGEDLPPFDGRVLAEPNVEFPWGRPATGEPARPEGRGSRAALWCCAAVVLVLLGWSLAARLERPALVTLGDSPSSVARSSESPVAPGTAVAHDVVESAREVHARATPVTAGPLAAGSSHPEPASSAVSAVHATVAAGSDAEAAVSRPVANVATPELAKTEPARATAATATTKAAPPGVSEHAIGAVPVARPATAASKPPPAASKALPDEDFGILPAVDSAPGASAATQATALPGTAKSAPPAIGSVGDLSRASQPLSGAVRKEPGSESSAKGSLLVETPPF
jgi:hypothetical protein